ncbi:MAG: methyltransferase domain-containing protein [Jatrophihabitans sp.]|nr:MAG: methyltransferase domain-containing protein [Jatrophihabitans sp.]
MRAAAQHPPAPGRLGLIWPVLLDALPASGACVLDCGGGSGTFAVPLAQAGAHVTVVDVSADALATLHRRAAEAGVAEQVVGRQGDVEGLAEVVDGSRFDLVLAHGVLGAVEALGPAFAAIAAAVRPGGWLSVVVANPVAAVLARAFAGDVAAALAELRALDTDVHAAGPDTVAALCRANGLQVSAMHGIGVFSDLLPGRALDAPGAREALDRLEAAASGRPPLRNIAARVHLMARRPD